MVQCAAVLFNLAASSFSAGNFSFCRYWMMGNLQSLPSIPNNISALSMLDFAIVSWIIVLLFPGFFVLAKFDNKSPIQKC
jgi:hypothetical protein